MLVRHAAVRFASSSPLGEIIHPPAPLSFGEKSARNISFLSPVVCDAVLKPYFASTLTDIWSALNNMNYVLRNKLLTPLKFLQEHFNPDPRTISIIISCTFSPVQDDMGTDCNKTLLVVSRWRVGGWGVQKRKVE